MTSSTGAQLARPSGGTSSAGAASGGSGTAARGVSDGVGNPLAKPSRLRPTLVTLDGGVPQIDLVLACNAIRLQRHMLERGHPRHVEVVRDDA